MPDYAGEVVHSVVGVCLTVCGAYCGIRNFKKTLPQST